MEPITQPTEKKLTTNTKDHACPQDQHCCDCDGCSALCNRGGLRRSLKGYWVRHFIILVLGVIAAFLVGYYLGQMKGYVTATTLVDSSM